MNILINNDMSFEKYKFKTYRVELNISEYEKELINDLFSINRQVYNFCLEKQIEIYKNTKKRITLRNLNLQFSEKYTYKISQLSDEYKNFYYGIIKDFVNGFKYFLYWVSVDKKSIIDDFPKYRGLKSIKKTCRIRGDIIAYSDRINVPILGCLNLKEHNYIPTDCKIYNVILSLSSNRYYILVTVEENLTAINHDLIGQDFILKSDMVNFKVASKYYNTFHAYIRMKGYLLNYKTGSNNQHEFKQRMVQKLYKLNNYRFEVVDQIVNLILKSKPRGIIVKDEVIRDIIFKNGLEESEYFSSFKQIIKQLKHKAKYNHTSVMHNGKFFPCKMN